MIENIISGFSYSLIETILVIAKTFIKIILAPLDIIISMYMPSINSITSYISTFLDYVFQYVGWAFDVFAIPSGVISLIISYFVLKYTIYFSIYIIKIVMGWIKK